MGDIEDSKNEFVTFIYLKNMYSVVVILLDSWFAVGFFFPLRKLVESYQEVQGQSPHQALPNYKTLFSCSQDALWNKEGSRDRCSCLGASGARN